MNEAAVLIALAALLIGVGVGWLLARAGMRELFGAHAAEALARNGADMIGRADERLAQREQAVEAMVAPLRDSLAAVATQLAEAERGRAGSDAALREQLRVMGTSSESLRDQTARLVTALRAPQVRGRWGELQLERVVEAAGMREHVDYDTQVSVPGDEGVQRPDLVVHLTGGRSVVVDSKVACSAYLDAIDAPDEATRDARLKAHARQLRHHVDALGSKSYWRRFSPTPEFVVCFVPADAFLDAALRADPDLLEHAFGRDVVLATPTTLVALLRTIAYGWRQEALAHNAEQVHELGRELYRRLSTLGDHFAKLGRSLGASVDAYNSAVGSLERRVLSKAREMNTLGVVAPDQALAEVTPLTTSLPRPLLAPELAEPSRTGRPRGDTGRAAGG